MITGLQEEILIEVLVKMGKYKIDDEVFEEAKKLYDEKIAERDKKKEGGRANKKQVLHF